LAVVDRPHQQQISKAILFLRGGLVGKQYQ
jgi:hypothetical protein